MERLRFTIDDVDPDLHVRATCERCREARYLTRPLLGAMAPGQLLAQVEARVRCVARPWSNKRGPACGGKMILDFHRAAVTPTARGSSIDEAAGMQTYIDRRVKHNGA
jgi:hypothetical protein